MARSLYFVFMFAFALSASAHSWAMGEVGRGCRIFLVPGAFGATQGGSSLFIGENEYFAEYRAFFESKGCQVRMGVFPADATIEERGLLLRDQVERFREGKRVALVAHSQGALDARFALKSLRLQGVDAVVSIGAPHHGTPVADWLVGHRQKESLLYWLFRWVGRYDFKALRFAAELSPEFLRRFAVHFEPVPGVRYASAQGNCKKDCYFWLRLVKWWTELPPGDGMVPAESQRFGADLGEYDLDHLSEIGIDAGKRGERRRFLEETWNFLSPVAKPASMK